MNFTRYCHVWPIDLITANCVFIPKTERILPPSCEQEILEKVAVSLNIPVDKILSLSREREVCEARFIAINYVKKLNPELTFERLGRIFKRHYSTVMYSITAHTELSQYNRNYKRKIKIVEPQLEGIRRTYAK